MPPPDNPEFVPAAPEVMGWIHHVTQRGIRRPGYAADDWTTGWAENFFRELHLEDVRLEEVPLPRWEPDDWLLEVWPVSSPDHIVQPVSFPLPHTAPAPGGIEGRLFAADSSPPTATRFIA
jgi:hypothetical protein